MPSNSNTITKKLVFYIIILFFVGPVLGQPAIYTQDIKTSTLIKKVIESMGGSAWDTVHCLSLNYYGYKNVIEQSERPDGPFIPSQFTATEIRELTLGYTQIDYSEHVYTFNLPAKYLINNDQVYNNINGKYYRLDNNQMVADETKFGPEIILKKALIAKDLKLQHDTMLQGSIHAIVSFSENKTPVRIFINKETFLVTAVEVYSPYNNDYFNIWGDCKKTTYYSFWNLLGKNIHYPLQSDVYVNGWYYYSRLINKWQINPKIDLNSLRVSDSTVSKTNILPGLSDLKKYMDHNCFEIAPGIWEIPGPCNSTLVEQSDGVVLIEASLSSDYGELLVQKSKELFPSKKIKAIISTSDAWLHIGGIRSLAAINGMKIYYPGKNEFIINKLLHAQYTTNPDNFHKQNSHNYFLKPVTDSVQIGSGVNKLMLYTYKTETGERMMMCYFPNHKLVYTSDLYQPKNAKGIYWNPQIAWEVLTSIQNRHLIVDRFYGMHTKSILQFSELLNDFK